MYPLKVKYNTITPAIKQVIKGKAQRGKMTNKPMTATPYQFEKLVARMMPAEIAEMGEGRLIAAVLTQAWFDAKDKRSAYDFFMDENSMLEFYCDKTGLNGDQIRMIFRDHSEGYKNYSHASTGT